MKDILIIVPSYKRQHKIAECVQAWRDTTSGRSDFLLVLESKDKPYPAMPDVLIKTGEFGCVGNAINAAFKAYPGYQYYAHINDDHHLRTKGWEEKVTEVLKDGGFAYGNDLLQGERLASAVVVNGETARKLGYIAVPELTHLYLDDCWMDIGRKINKLFYLPDVIIEHMHPGAGKAKMDSEYIRVNSDYAKYLAIYNDWKATKLDKEAAKCL